MNKLKYILSGLLLFVSLALFSQDEANGTVTYVGNTVEYTVNGLSNSVFIWEVNGEGNQVIDDNGNNIFVTWGCQPGEYTIKVQEVTSNECLGEQKVATIEVRPISVLLDAYYDACQGEQVQIMPDIVFSNEENLQFNWLNSSGEKIADTRQLSLDANDIVSLEVTDKISGCQATVSEIEIEIHPLPEFDINYMGQRIDSNKVKNITLCGTENGFLTLTDFYTSYKWSTGANNDQLAVGPDFENDRTIWVEVTDEFGCKNSDTIYIAYCDINEILDNIPNAFNPKEEEWQIKHKEQFTSARLEIFDRWGRLIFSTNNPTSDFWDGHYKGELLPADTYYYILDLGADKQANPVAGEVNLIY